ncbi:MAG: ATP-grasp domain-containing protein [Acidobacteria bacterium]|nr:ATP-grasp domain-containing protein [Acidobacteriota bacterium]
MPTLILSPRYTEDGQLLWKAALDAGWHIHRLSSWQIGPEARSIVDPVLYVEAMFAPTFAEELGVVLSEPSLDWLPKLPFRFRLRDIQLMTLGEAHRLEKDAFVKPPNDKSFAAKVYSPGGLPEDFPESMPVLVAEPVTWENEFRCFFLDQKLVTYSVYARWGELQDQEGYQHSPEEETELHTFLAEILSDSNVSFPNAAVLDVGKIQGKGWAVVEQNAAWGAGLYGADPALVLQVIRKATQQG